MATAAQHSPDPLSRLETGLHGSVVRPGSPEYDEARSVWSGMIDKRPRAVARCADVEDVVRCVDFARRYRWPLAVRGGSHNVAGLATVDDGLVIDLSGMRRVTVDAVRRVARVEGGATWADVDGAGQQYALATPGGLISETGVAGLTLSGGLGWLRGKHGVTCDNVISAELVTADGRVVTASESENPDLLWALRGGGGNFGVVTAFEFRLHPVGPEVMFAFVFHDGRRRREALRFFREFAATTPDELAPVAVLGTVPQGAAEFPLETHGRTFAAFAGPYIGPVEVGERVVRPLREFGEPLADFSGPTSWLDVQSVFNAEYPRGQRYYWKSALLDDLSDEAIEVIARAADAQVSELTTIDVWHPGGAVRREPPGGRRLRRPHRDVHGEPRGQLGLALRRRGQHAVGAQAGRRPAALLGRRQLPELPRARRGGRGPDAGRLRRPLRASRGGQDQVGSGEPVPPEPEHRAPKRRGMTRDPTATVRLYGGGPNVGGRRVSLNFPVPNARPAAPLNTARRAGRPP